MAWAPRRPHILGSNWPLNPTCCQREMHFPYRDWPNQPPLYPVTTRTSLECTSPLCCTFRHFQRAKSHRAAPVSERAELCR